MSAPDPRVVMQEDDIDAARAALARGGPSAKAFANTALHHCRSGAMARLLIGAGANVHHVAKVWGDIGTALPRHAAAGRLEIVELLLAAGADPDAVNEWNVGPLQYSIVQGHLDIALLLIARGANVVAACGRASSLVGHVAMLDHAELLRQLLRAGASLEERCSVVHDKQREQDRVVRFSADGMPAPVLCGTPLHVAAWFGAARTARVLLDAGARTDVVDAAGRSPLALARRRRHGEVAALLRAAGARPVVREDEDRRLVRAIHAGDLAAARSSLAAGAKPDAALIDEARFVPVLVLASERGDRAAVELLLDAGAAIDAHAFRHREASTLETVATLGAVMTATSNASAPRAKLGVTALDAALHGKHLAVADLLVQRGARTESSLAAAALGGSADAVRWAVENAESAPGARRAALLGAAARSQAQAVEALLAAAPERTAGEEGVMNVLLAAGSDASLRGTRARARRAGHTHIVGVVDEMLRPKPRSSAPSVPAPTAAELRQHRADLVRARVAAQPRRKETRGLATWLARSLAGVVQPWGELPGAWVVTRRRRGALDWGAIDARASRAGCAVLRIGQAGAGLVVLPIDHPLEIVGLVCEAVPERAGSLKSVLRFLHGIHAELGARVRRIDIHYVELALLTRPSVERADEVARQVRRVCPDLPEDVDPRTIADGTLIVWWGDSPR